MPAKKPASKTTRPSKSLISSNKTFNRPIAGLIIAAMAIIGLYVIFRSQAAGNPPPQPFVDQPSRGLVWAGLKNRQAGSVCGRLYEVVNEHGQVTQCTHGPDPAPDGVDVRKSVMPVRTGEVDKTAAETTSTGGTAAATSLIPCDGDGTTGKRIQALYVHASNVPSRYNQFASSFQTWAGGTNNAFVESGLQTGGARNLRWVHDANCNVIVTDVTITATGDDNFTNTMSELQQLGYNRVDRKYLLWVDASIYCGIGTIYGDDRSSGNINDGGPSYARADNGCWGYAEQHELMHNIGGVQLSAPHTSGGYHCTDEYDEECYSDASGVVMTYPCASTQARVFDCNKDDYFYAGAPPAGNYLATHWNTANSAYLISGGGSTSTSTQCNNVLDDDGDGKVDYPADPGCSSLDDTSESPDPIAPPPTDIISPTVTINSPANNSNINNKVTVSVSATDNIGVTKVEVYIDGVLKTTSTSSTANYSWNSRRASAGTHTITSKAYDATGNFGQASVTVYK